MKGVYLRPNSGLSLEDCQEILGFPIRPSEWGNYSRGTHYLVCSDVWSSACILRVGKESLFEGKDFKEVTVDDLFKVCI